VQGCSRRCPGCWNPATHAPQGGYEVSIDSISTSIPYTEVEGITISGGEPFEQAEELASVLERAATHSLHRLVYTGFRYEVLVALDNEAVMRCLTLTDMLIDGAYQQDTPAHLPWTGSGNQRVLVLSKGTIQTELDGTHEYAPDRRLGEVLIDREGRIVATGFFDSRIFGLGCEDEHFPQGTALDEQEIRHGYRT
jgi:anaerobic ribonucleoside-triphosphate reductase activating protein